MMCYMGNTTLLDQFKENARQVQALVHGIPSKQDAVDYVIGLALDHQAESLVGIGLDRETDRILDRQCRTHRLERRRPPLRHRADRIPIALTPADWGIADTGSLVVYSDSEDLRIATMMAEIHIAMIAPDRIVPRLDDLNQILAPVLNADRASYTAVITGASRTADIERILAIGVHGPRELHILISGDVSDD